MEQHRPVCLSIGGSDSCGGAGIQADLRVFETLAVQGCSATTALTAQNPEKIIHIQASSAQHFAAELDAITSYYDISCIKTGMLWDAQHVQTLIAKRTHTPLIVDPVLIASSGKHLFEKGAARKAYEQLIPLATVWTPNLQEAAFFLHHDIHDPVEAASELLLKYRTPVLLKGGHSSNAVLQDIFCDLDGTIDIFTHAKLPISTHQAHGTGCRLASAITAFFAHGESLPNAISKAHQWLQNQLQQS